MLQLFCHGRPNGLNVSRAMAFSMPLSVVGIRKNCKVTILGEYGARVYGVIWCTDNNSLMDNAIRGRQLSCRRNHFPVAHDSGRRRRITSRKRCGKPWWIFWFTVWNRTGQIFFGLSAIHTVSELSWHMLYYLTQDHRHLLILCLPRKSDIWRLLLILPLQHQMMVHQIKC